MISFEEVDSGEEKEERSIANNFDVLNPSSSLSLSIYNLQEYKHFIK